MLQIKEETRDLKSKRYPNKLEIKYRNKWDIIYKLMTKGFTIPILTAV